MSWRKGNIPDRKRWRRFRITILDRDGWKCVKCGKRGRLEVDHIKPLWQGSKPFDPANCQSLCRSCHISKTRLENTNTVSTEQVEWREYLGWYN